MAYAPRTTGIPSHLRPSSGLATNPSSSNASNASNANTQTTLLQARITEKKAELENLKQLRDLSAGLAEQMQQLEAKLATLSTGTEAVAEVLGNWSHVLRAIWMASAKIPKAKDAEGEEDAASLPQTLVRIPIRQAEAAQRDAEAAADAAGE